MVGARYSWFTLALLLQSCSQPADQPEAVDAGDSSGTPVVFAVNYPLAFFAERIGGELVDVRLPIPADVDPATWSPGFDVIGAYQRADLILLNGAGYAAWAGRASLPVSRTVDTSAGFSDRYLAVEDAVTHTHGPDGEHAHGAVAFTTWLDPEFAMLQAAAIRDALIATRPRDADAFRSGYESLARDLRAIDDGLQAVFAMLGGQPLLFSHPVYQYLAHRYSLDEKFVHFEPGQQLDGDDLENLRELLASHPAGIMIWEAEPADEARTLLNELGIASVVFDPCANRPDHGDYLACMRRNQANLESLL